LTSLFQVRWRWSRVVWPGFMSYFVGVLYIVGLALVDHPIAAINSAAKGGLEAVMRSLAMEHAKQGIRVNAVAPGIVDTPMPKDDAKDFLKTPQSMGQISEVQDIVDAIVYLTEAHQVLHVDGGAHVGKW
jgi:NAD(P)-dependent dehydrogenase (short-subunit alcohol dehydrogenase family)